MTRKLILLILLLGSIAQGICVYAADKNSFIQKNKEFASIPIRIEPVLVDAPPRYINLLSAAQRKVELASQQALDIIRIPLNGMPIDLYEYPMLKFKNSFQNLGVYALEFGFDRGDKGVIDTFLRIGSPLLFPDMLKERIDLVSEQIKPKDLMYKITNKLGLDYDGKWHYAALSGIVNSVNNGVVSASLRPRGGMILSRSFESVDILKTPWLNYKFVLPEDLKWTAHVDIKVTHGRNIFQSKILASETVKGVGKQNILINIYDLLQKSYPNSKEDNLKEVLIYYELDEPDSQLTHNVQIKLGSIEFYNSQVLTKNGIKAFLVSNDVKGANINLQSVINKELSTKSKFILLDGALLAKQDYLASDPMGLPSVSIASEFQEKIPELFVGDRFLLGELSGTDLDAVLDQKIFYEKSLLWISDKSAVNIKNKSAQNHSLIDFFPKIKLKGDVYIMADILFENDARLPLNLTLFGKDNNGESIIKSYELHGGKPIRVSSFLTVDKATLSLFSASKYPYQTSFLINNFKILSFNKSTKFNPNPTVAFAKISPTNTSTENANPVYFDLSILKYRESQLKKSFVAQNKLIDNSEIVYQVENSKDESADYFFSVKTVDKLNLHKLDATLSYEQIVGGGKDLNLPEEMIESGTNTLKYVASKDISLTLNPVFLENSNKYKQLVANEDMVRNSQPNLIKFGWFCIALIFIGLFSFKYQPILISILDKTLAVDLVLLPLISVFFASSWFLIFIYKEPDAVTWGGALIVSAYSLIVRYKIRPYLVTRSILFCERPSVLYVMLLVVLLLITFGLLKAKQNLYAELVSVIGYYLFVMVMAIELLGILKKKK